MPPQKVRKFATGATRDTDVTKPDYEGFLSPLVVKRFGVYMHKHRIQPDGGLRDSDNWQKGIPLDAYMKSGFRHFMDWWLEHRGRNSRDGLEDALCGLLFNVQGYLHEVLKHEECKDCEEREEPNPPPGTIITGTPWALVHLRDLEERSKK